MCINPYHYKRVEWGGVLPPIMVPRSSNPALQSEIYSQGATYSQSQPPTINAAGHEGSTNMDSISWPATVATPSPSDTSLPDLGEDVLDHLTTSTVQYFEPGTTWCSIKYFELNRRVGEVRMHETCVENILRCCLYLVRDIKQPNHQLCFPPIFQ